MKQFIDKHKVYQSTQSGYRKGHSCITVLLKLRDDIQCALNSSEVAIALFANYSKAFDTIRYDILLKKLNELGFSSSFIHLINSYLTDRYQFVQIEDKKSALAQVTCGVPQGSILGPILFNLYVTDISTFTSSTCLQFAGDTTLYKRCKVKDIPDCANIIQNDVEHLKAWSDVNSLVFNGTKTKTMIFSTKQMSRYHYLDNADTYSVVFNGNEAKNKIERKDSMKIRGMKVDQHLTWKEHVANVIMSSYDTLRSLKLLKRYTPYKLRKTLAEALILSKIDYGSDVYQNIPKFLIKRLQKVQTISAGYVLNRYAKECNVIKLGWLPIIERFEFNTTKLAFKA